MVRAGTQHDVDIANLLEAAKGRESELLALIELADSKPEYKLAAVEHKPLDPSMQQAFDYYIGKGLLQPVETYCRVIKMEGE